MKNRYCSLRWLLLILFVPALLLSQKAKMSGADVVDIPYKMFKLDNGLTVIIHEDHKAPIVAVNIWYHVGSKNERLGKSGFAHLFEHLMFNGSEDYNDDYFQALERVGATDMNGTTNEDRTNYFQNVPTSAFDLALWMESDRMGHLLGAIDQGKLDEQRGVVQNEKRQDENQPYAISDELITKATWPAGHPYAHTVIGSMDDLNAASLSDVKDWFRTYYGPSNAVLSIAGDVRTDDALARVKKYFGDIPPGPPVARFSSWVAKRAGVQREVAQDRVPQARVYKVWNIPGWGTADLDYLNLASDILATGKSSRLYYRLVYKDQIATNVNAYIDRREIAGQFVITATAKPGEGLAAVEKAIDEEMAKFLKSGPTEVELRRAKALHEAAFLRGIERIGGFGGTSDILAQNEVYGGSPDYYKTTLRRMKNATVKDIQKATAEWLSDGVYVLDIVPYPTLSAAAADTMIRKSLPAVGAPPVAKFPAFERKTLANGMKLIFVHRPTVPIVQFTMLFDAGYATDVFSTLGTANLAMNMLDEGTKTRTALQISDELQLLGARLNTGSNLDISTVSMSALKTNLDKSLDLYADVILNPSFPKADFERLQKQTIAGIKREKAQPIQMGVRVLAPLLYGTGHPYGIPLTGSGTEESVAKLTRNDMVKFQQTWIRPNNATLIVIGDATMDEIVPRLERAFKNWKPGDVPKKNITDVSPPTKPVVYLMDKPGALQSIIFAAELTLPQNNPDEIAVQAMNTVLGGAFTSRINMNLREAKHWSYGAGSFIYSTAAQRPFIAYGPVQTDKTKESMVEMRKELDGIVGDHPVTEEELKKVKSNLTLELPGVWETNSSVAGYLANIVRYHLADDYYQTYPDKIDALSLNQLNEAAKEVVKPNQLVWVVVGDRQKIEEGVRDLQFGELKFLDSNGMVEK
jgi:zinc protease